MKKISTLIIGLALLFSATFAMAYAPALPSTTIVTAKESHNADTSIRVESADGDFDYTGGSGSPDEMYNYIIARSNTALGNLRLSTLWSSEDGQCFAYGQLIIPLKVENGKIVLPSTSYYSIDKISYSDEKCRATGIKSFGVAVDSKSLPIMKAHASR